MECPCRYDCTKRSPTCHGECIDYKTWREELDKINKKVRDAKISYTDSHLMKLHWRNIRRKC